MKAAIGDLEVAALCLYTQRVSRQKDLLELSFDLSVPGVTSYQWAGIKIPGTSGLLPWGDQMHSYYEGSSIAACVFSRNVLGDSVPEFVVAFQEIPGSNVGAEPDADIERRYDEAKAIAEIARGTVPSGNLVFTGFRLGGQMAAVLGFDFGHRTVAFNPSPVPPSFRAVDAQHELRAQSIKGFRWPRYVIVRASGRPLGGPVDGNLWTQKKVRIPAGEMREDLLETVLVSLYQNLAIKGVSQRRLEFATDLVRCITPDKEHVHQQSLGLIGERGARSKIGKVVRRLRASRGR
jgi:hypothetical protein